MRVAFIRPLTPAVGHIIVHGGMDRGYIKNAVALCGYSTEKAQVDVAVVCGDTLADVDCKKCLRKLGTNPPGRAVATRILHTTINGVTTTEIL